MQETRTDKKAKRTKVSEIKRLTREVSSLERKIQASKSTVTIEEVEGDEDEEEEITSTNAGTQFRGRNKKKGKKSWNGCGIFVSIFLNIIKYAIKYVYIANRFKTDILVIYHY